MKILYGIQATGHGHISRAREILPILSGHADVDVMASGYNCQLRLHGYQVKQKRGISLKYGNGRISLLETIRGVQPVTLARDIRSLPVNDYDLIISDYEPVTAWASLYSGIPSIGLSHQASFYSSKSPRPRTKSIVGEQILKYYAPCSRPLGFHFRRYDRFIEPPIVRREVRELNPYLTDSVLVYLPAFDPQALASVLSTIREIKWNIFSPECTERYTKGNITVNPVGNEAFMEGMENCLGVITGAGFETCSEAMFLGKKLLVLPIKHQYEQECNAAALSEMGVQTLNSWGPHIRSQLQDWIYNSPVVELTEVANTEGIIERLVRFAGKRG